MRETLIVLKREFKERVHTKSFVLSTLLIPVFLAALFVGPALLGAGGGERDLVLVSEAPPAVGEAFVRTLTAPPGEDADEAYTYRVEPVAGSLDDVRAELNRRVVAREIDGYVYLPADVVERGEILYRARNISAFRVERDIRRAASEAAQGARLRERGLEVTQVASLLRPVAVQSARVTEKGEDAGSAESTFLLGYLVGFLVYFLTFLYGVNVMRSVLEEKTNRIVEVIVSSMKPRNLMMGKILGVGAVALLQVSLWGAMLALAATSSDTLVRTIGLPPGALDALKVDPWILVASAGFFLLGFGLYAALFAAVGAAVNSDQEAQQYQVVVFLPLIASLMTLVRVISDPLGPFATAVGLIPLSAPVVMPMRMAAAAVPPAEVAASLGLLALGVVVVTWLAGKIYRVGILSTGKKPSLRDLGRWLRSA